MHNFSSFISNKQTTNNIFKWNYIGFTFRSVLIITDKENEKKNEITNSLPLKLGKFLNIKRHPGLFLSSILTQSVPYIDISLRLHKSISLFLSAALWQIKQSVLCVGNYMCSMFIQQKYKSKRQKREIMEYNNVNSN